MKAEETGRPERLSLLPFAFLLLPSYLRTRTGSSINAGTYKLRLTLVSPAPLLLDALEVE